MLLSGCVVTYFSYLHFNLVNQLATNSFLSKLGCNVTLATNGKEAIAQFKNNYFDMILMDCQMPEIDGYEATKMIRMIEKIVQVAVFLPLP